MGKQGLIPSHIHDCDLLSTLKQDLQCNRAPHMQTIKCKHIHLPARGLKHCLFLSPWIMVLPNSTPQKPPRKYWKAVKKKNKKSQHPIFNYYLELIYTYIWKDVYRKINWIFTISKLVVHSFVTCKKRFSAVTLQPN